MASCCTHPIDQQKYRMQVVKGKTGMLESLSRTARTAGGCGVCVAENKESGQSENGSVSLSRESPCSPSHGSGVEPLLYSLVFLGLLSMCCCQCVVWLVPDSLLIRQA
jgi:hypothetical protein